LSAFSLSKTSFVNVRMSPTESGRPAVVVRDGVRRGVLDHVHDLAAP
jgi:hypothetical protein